MSGWNLTGRLVLAHFGALGDRIAAGIATFDPETATQADRDQLAETLRQTATKLASARIAFEKEHADVVNLEKQIAADTSIFDTLADRLAAGTIKESSVTLFCDELEANKGRLPTEQAEEAQAKEFMDQIQQIVDSLSAQLTEFDRHAKAAITSLRQAEAKQQLEQMRQSNQETLTSIGGIKRSTTALDALTRKAGQINASAEGMRIVSSINQKPLDDAAEVDALRKSASQPAAEGVLERLKRLKAEAAA